MEQTKQAQKQEIKAGKYILKLKGDHPEGKFRIQGHIIDRKFRSFDLSLAEAKELFSKGAQHWVEIKR
jgi:hypothetical protein